MKVKLLNERTAKRLLSVALTLTMFTGMFAALPMATFAVEDNFQIGDDFYETLEDAVATVPNDGTILMLKNMTVSGDDIEIGIAEKSYTLNLGGYTLLEKDRTSIMVLKGTVTIRNGSITADFVDGVGIWVEGGNVTLDGLSVSAPKGTATEALVVLGG